jgi:RHS repeat-associated protein
VVGTFSYGPTGTLTSPLGFAGGYTDAETGFEYLVNRYYDPASDQFLSVDPLEASTHAPYYYASDNVANYTDPSGAATEGKCGAAIAVLAIGKQGLGGNGTVCIVHTVGEPKDEWGLTETSFTSVDGGLAAGISLSVEYQNTTARNVGDLAGPFADMNFSGRFGVGLTGDVFRGDAVDGSSVVGMDFGAGVGPSIGVYVAHTWTTVQIAHNVFAKAGLEIAWGLVANPGYITPTLEQIKSLAGSMFGGSSCR